MRQTKALLTILLVLFVSAMAAVGLGAPVATTPQSTQGTPGSASVLVSKEAEKIEAERKARDSGGTPAYSIKVTASQEFRSDKEEPGTTQPVYGEHVIFGGTREAIRQGGGAPVGTVEVAAVFSVDASIYASQTHQDTMREKGDGATKETQLKAEAQIPGYA